MNSHEGDVSFYVNSEGFPHLMESMQKAFGLRVRHFNIINLLFKLTLEDTISLPTFGMLLKIICNKQLT